MWRDDHTCRSRGGKLSPIRVSERSCELRHWSQYRIAPHAVARVPYCREPSSVESVRKSSLKTAVNSTIEEKVKHTLKVWRGYKSAVKGRVERRNV